MIGPDHYRYRDILTEDGQVLHEEVYQVIKETPSGYWVRPVHGARLSTVDQWQYAYENRKRNREGIRFVLKVSGRRHCYPDRRDAMLSFGQRKAAQIKHAETSLAKARHALEAATRICTVGNDYPRTRWLDEINVGMPPEFAKYSFY